MMLWLCLHLPRLPLDALPAGPPEQPRAVIDARQRLLCLNLAAEQQGLSAGLLMSSAQSVCPTLHCLERQEDLEHSALRSLAHWALRYSSHISLQPPQDLLIEIGGSLRLFGSVESLRAQLEQEAQALHYAIQPGIAPTIPAAQVMSRCQRTDNILQLKDLAPALNNSPVVAMNWPDKTIKRLQAVGVHTLGQCRRLPRDGFIRRYGKQACRQLDELWGEQVCVVERFVPDSSFGRCLELFSETEVFAMLLPGFERLFEWLKVQLQGVGCGIQTLDIELQHARGSNTRLRLLLQSPSRDAEHWLGLLEQRFARLNLPAPVRGIGVYARHFLPLPHQQNNLWQQVDAQQQQELMECLAARLGSSTLKSLRTQASHSPEHSWKDATPTAACSGYTESRPRPLWLLPEPQIIAAVDIVAHSPAERLETQWWEQSCQRDYYRAVHRNGQRLWVFRQHGQPDHWYIHGLFA